MARSRNLVQIVIVVISTITLLFVSGCGKPAGETPSGEAGAAPEQAAEAIPEAAVKEATEIFSGRCLSCHGATGVGDGPASKGLNPPPRDLTDPAWQASVTDQYIETIIKFGGGAVGKSIAMPPNPDLTAREDVIRALRAHVRSLKNDSAPTP